jgi:hypothetical protein
MSALDLTLPSYMAPMKPTKMSMPPIGTIAPLVISPVAGCQLALSLTKARFPNWIKWPTAMISTPTIVPA